MTTGNTPMTPGALVAAGFAVAQQSAVLLPPNIALGITVANGIYNAVLAAMSQGRDMTDEDLDQALSLDEAEKALGAIARARAAALEQTAAPGGTQP